MQPNKKMSTQNAWNVLKRLLLFPFYSAHSAPFVKFPPLLRGGGVCISLIVTEPRLQRILQRFLRINSWTNFFQNFISVHNYMKDAKCTETNKKSIFRFLVDEIWSFLYSKFVNFSMNFECIIHHNSKNKNQKIDFSFVSVHLFSKFDNFWTIFLWSVTHLKIPVCHP